MRVKLPIVAIAFAHIAFNPDTAAWWGLTAELSNDRMQRRDAGSAAYMRAARLVASKFEAASRVRSFTG